MTQRIEHLASRNELGDADGVLNQLDRELGQMLTETLERAAVSADKP